METDQDTETTTEQDFESFLQFVLQDTEEETDEGSRVERTSTFNDVGMMTRNNGIVVQMSDGSEFQVTIVRSR